MCYMMRVWLLVAINILCNGQNTKSGKFETADGKLVLITKRVLDLCF